MSYLPEWLTTNPYKPPTHNGVDKAMPVGTVLPSMLDGVVKLAQYIPPPAVAPPGTGKELVVVIQSDALYISYGHLSTLKVSLNQKVLAGQTIALSGNSGYVTGAHCHFEARKGTFKNFIDANPLLNITPIMNNYGGTGMANGQIVNQLYIKLAGRVLNPNNAGDKRVYDEKKGFLDSGGNVGTLAEDILRSANLFYGDDRIVNELYIAASGQLPENWLNKQKSAALGAGLPLNQLINEVVPRTCDPSTVADAQKYRQIKSITG